ncbi:SusC/RagA family TonB-linked outer membrane protein [Yeosuana marina]|uniref:SusC/RagA family TonB-linked outer membrane protein n=1 Tax=Yeosuana marina TaxID=1565536 RepID=UPI0030EF44FB|tara:strand:- start:2906 stop:6424 length:3519 start_codon:yes stop_codon:yes gene_type:complete
MEIKLTRLFFPSRKGAIIWVMRIFIFLLCTTVFGLTSKESFSQTTVIINQDETVSVDQVFKIIQQQTDYTFLYQKGIFNDLPMVKLKKGKIRLDTLINKSITGAKFNVILSGNNTIIIQGKDKQQQMKVTGTITDETGLPVPGVTVLIKGTTKGTSTDLDGNYVIMIPSPGNILIFSAIGFKTQEVIVGDRNTVDVVLKEDISKLDEVEINTGYQKIKPEQRTGSISMLSFKEYDSRINTTSILEGIQNKIPGLLVNNDVKFEGNNLFQIRGISTINGNKNPLIVVDGYPSDLSLDMINPNDIESVTVLKDAAAAAIYGVRSSNGVIVIERKKAKIGKLRVAFRNTVSMTPKENLGRYRWDKDGANTNIDYYRGVYEGATSPFEWEYLNSLNSGGYYTYQAPRLIIAQQAAGDITPAQAETKFKELGAYNNANEYADLFLRTAIASTYNVDISGGDRNVLYYLNANIIDRKSSLIKNGDKSFNLSGRGTFNFSNRFSLDLTNNFKQDNGKASPVPDINNIFPYERFYDGNGNQLPLFYGSNANPYYNQALMERGLLDNMYYPLVDVNEISNASKTTNNRITANFNYKLSNALNLKFGGVYESSTTNISHYASENSSEAHQLVNGYASNGPNGSLVYNIPIGGYLKEQVLGTQGYTVRAQLDFNTKIKEDHAFYTILGTEIRSLIEKSNTSSFFGYNDQTLANQQIDYRSLFVTRSIYGNYQSGAFLFYDDLFGIEYNENRYFSVYANTSYSYKSKYSVTGSIRIDQSNLFGTDPKYRYKPLWSVGASWDIHKEEFLDNADWLNSLKLRTAYGFNGNVAKNSLPQIIARNGFFNFGIINPIPRLFLSSPANKGLRWEETHTFNIGLDYSIFKSIKGSFDYYVKESSDLLARTLVDPSRGVSTALINQASIKNSGFEFKLNADWITNQNFNWNTGIVASINDSKVLDVYNVDNGMSRQYIDANGYSNYLKGYEVGAVFNYRYAGVDENGAPLIYDIDGNKKPILDNQSKDDLDYVGSSIPTLNAGLSNRLDIGNFYVYAMVNYYGGFKSRIPMPTPSATRPLEGANNYWKQPGDEADPNILPALGYRSTYDIYVAASDKYTVNGSYLTIGDLTCAYSLNNKVINKIGFSGLEFRLQASNIYTVGFNDFNYSLATGSFAKSYLTPTYTFAVTANF